MKQHLHIFSIILIGVLMFASSLTAQVKMDVPLDLIIDDIYSFLSEIDSQIDFEGLEADLRDLASHPLDLNTATEEDLQKLRFLSPEQIDAILLYVYQHPMHSIYELQLIPELKQYEIRNLLPFVTVKEKSTEKKLYWKEVLPLGQHDIYLRTDARNIQSNGKDPFYVSLKYGFNFSNRIQWGITAEHDVGEPWWRKGKIYGFDFYSGYFQMQDIGILDKLVVGDFRASFGQGLVMNMNRLYGGKTSLVTQAGMGNEGLKRFASTTEYDFLRGAGATLNCGQGFKLTAFYSARKIDSRPNNGITTSLPETGYHITDTEINGKRTTWQQVIGLNLTWRYKHLKLGLTMSENILGDTLKPTPNYYNKPYFHGKRQASIGLNYYYHYQHWSIFGEVATAQNTQWGWANITAVRFAPVSDISLIALYRYYSPTYDNMLGNAFAENSRNNDENGLYLGAEIKRIRNWRFALYADGWYFSLPKYGIREKSYGWDVFGQADYYTTDNLNMSWKVRAKQKGPKDKYSLRYQLRWAQDGWKTNTMIEGNIAVQESESINQDITFGGVIAQDIAYTFPQIPITLQARIAAFHTKDYDNRIYLYENDVLHAYSTPSLYGVGGRFYFNARYKINETISIYTKIAHTAYTTAWATEKEIPANKTDVRLLVRLTL